MKIIEKFTEAGYGMSEYTNHKNVIKQLNAVLSNGIEINICTKGRVWHNSDKTSKYNVSVVGFGKKSTAYCQHLEPMDVLKICASFLKRADVKENLLLTVSEPCTCPKCDGKGHIPAFDYYADGVCFSCSGSGIVGKLKIRNSKKVEIVKLDPTTMTDLKSLYIILLSNDKKHLVEGVRQAAFDRAIELGFLEKVGGDFSTWDSYLQEEFSFKYAYKWNCPLRTTEFWASSIGHNHAPTFPMIGMIK